MNKFIKIDDHIFNMSNVQAIRTYRDDDYPDPDSNWEIWIYRNDEKDTEGTLASVHRTEKDAHDFLDKIYAALCQAEGCQKIDL